MKKIKVSEASGPVLDWLVAHAQDMTIELRDGKVFAWLKDALGDDDHLLVEYQPRRRWSQGGPIIEREGIWVSDPSGDVLHPRQWGALLKGTMHDTRGPTPLIAAMRCFVASRLGEEVEVPEELL